MNRELNTYLLKSLLTTSNVVGYSKVLQPKISKGVVYPDIQCLRFYVSKKQTLKQLNERDIIPPTILDIPTDIWVSGEWKLPLPKLEVTVPTKTSRVRPLVAGISIGNKAITAGTWGYFYLKRGEILGGSNAHVTTDDPSKEVSGEKRILQPGSYDGGTLNDIIGEYEWHQRISPIGDVSDCEVANGVIKVLNGFSRAFGRKTRFSTILDISNHIDFGTFHINEAFNVEFIDCEIANILGVGHGFAGSDTTSLTCKGSYIEAQGYKPVGTKFVEVLEGNIIYKTGRTSCYTNTHVIDRSGVSQVNYGSFTAIFDDIIISDKLLEPGDSGSFVWTKEADI